MKVEYQSAPWKDISPTLSTQSHHIATSEINIQPATTISIPGTPDTIRNTTAYLGTVLARNLDRYWQASKAISDGPIEVIDMFSGCGGMSAGFRSVNGLFSAFRHIVAIDIDKVANTSYKANLGLEPLQEDIKSIAQNKTRLQTILRSSNRRKNHPLILIGCAPCQGFSSHRHSAGQQDTRNPLFVDFARAAVILRPDAIVIENVPELLTSQNWPYVSEVRNILEQSGYFVHLGIYNMADFGVPQERFRAVMLALPKAFRPLTGFLHKTEFRTVRQAISNLPPIEAGARLTIDKMHYTAGHKESTIATIQAVPKDGGNRPAHVGPLCLQRLEQRQGKAGYEDIYGRLYWDRPAVTITAYARNPASGRFIHPEQDRGLSIREASLLQGFPGDYWFAGSLDEGFRQIGNAVPPTFASYLALYLVGEMLGPTPAQEEFDKGITQPIGPSFSRLIPALKAGYRKIGTKIIDENTAFHHRGEKSDGDSD
jgi:DNA (cytosine-5)-methyltransferase 1